MFSFSILCFVHVKVWAMADSKRQGFLGLPEFITAMQVVYKFLFRFASAYWLNLTPNLLLLIDSWYLLRKKVTN